MPALKPYACKDRPATARFYVAQAGWQNKRSTSTRTPEYVEVQHAMSQDCKYSESTPDTRCAGCVHNKQENPQ